MPRLFRHQVLLKARLELGLTQEQLAESLGVDVRTYRRYESGSVNEGGFSVRQPARRKLMESLCSELGLAHADLIVDEEAAPTDDFAPAFEMTLQKAPHFVGREALLDQLWVWANGGCGPRVNVLVGVGGIGKTAVAERLLHRLGVGPKPFGVFVWSFYDDERVEVFLQRAARYFARVDVTQAEASERLSAALADGSPHLLVLDGAERVQSDGAGRRAYGEVTDPLLRRLLLSLAQGLGNTRALVTSRYVLSDLTPWEGDGANFVHLPPLSPELAARLLHAWGATGDGATSRQVIEATGGHALSLAVAGSYASSFGAGDLRSVAQLDLAEHAHDEPLARRLSGILSTYAAALPPLQRDLMARLSTLPAGADEELMATLSGAPAEVAGALTGATKERLRWALVRLERLGLVYRTTERGHPARWSSHPFVRDYFRSLLGGVEVVVRRALAGPKATLVGAPGVKATESTHLDTLEQVCEQLLNAGQVVEAFRVYRDVMGGFAHLGLVLGEMSRGARVSRRFGEPGVEASALSRLGPSWEALFLYERGLFAGALGDLGYATQCYERCIQLEHDAHNPQRVAIGLRTLAYTQRLRGALPTALKTVGESIDLAKVHDITGQHVLGLALRAAILHDLGEVEAARAVFTQLAERNELGESRRGLWYAEHLIATGRYAEARRLLESNVEGSERRGWIGHVAHGRALLGLALLHLEPSAAPDMLAASRRWAHSSGEVEMQLRVHELGYRVALSRDEHAEAAAQLLAGEQLAVATGAGLFLNRFAELRLGFNLARMPG